MDYYHEAKAVTIVVPFKDGNTNDILVTSFTSVLYDGERNIVLDLGETVVDKTMTAAKQGTVVIPATANALHGDDLQEVRVLEVVLKTGDTEVEFSSVYVIEAEQSLQVMRNSFMTYETALMMSRQLVTTTDFKSATKDNQRLALAEAYSRITGLSMIYPVYSETGYIQGYRSMNAWSWLSLQASDFNSFPANFKKALRSAQLFEANYLLQDNTVAQKAAQGIQSETIGESSVTLRSGYTGTSGSTISSTAMSILGPFLDSSIKIARA